MTDSAVEYEAATFGDVSRLNKYLADRAAAGWRLVGPVQIGFGIVNSGIAPIQSQQRFCVTMERSRTSAFTGDWPISDETRAYVEDLVKTNLAT